jgi:hypothetical protein
MLTPLYTFDNDNLPTDPQIRAVYNSMTRTQKATYATLTTNQERSNLLYVLSEEKKKPVCLLRWCTFAFELFTKIYYNDSGGVAY